MAGPPLAPAHVSNEGSGGGCVCVGAGGMGTGIGREGPKSLVVSQPGTSSVGTVTSDPGSEPGSSSSGCEFRPSYLASLSLVSVFSTVKLEKQQWIPQRVAIEK